jgi:transcriptional regulator with XRE-family HTH domain
VAATRDALHQAFGRVLSEFRRQSGLTQEQLAFRSGMHVTYVSLLERGLTSPSLAKIEALANALGQRPHVLVKAAEDRAHRGQLAD